jgi:hypothetical protein
MVGVSGVTGIRASLIIPSFKDQYMPKTVQSFLDASELGDALEVIVVLDGYWADFKLVEDSRVRYCHLGTNVGMRGAINAGIRLARGEFLFRADEHQDFSKGIDRVLCDACQPNWIMTARRYALNPVEWINMPEVSPVDRMKLKIVHYDRGEKFSGTEWKRPEGDSRTIIESQAMQGSFWMMPHSLWDNVVGPLESSGYGTHYGDSHEMVFRLWQHGGALMVHTGVWHSHKFRKYPRTHSYGGEAADKGYAFALATWRDYYEKELLPKWATQQW